MKNKNSGPGFDLTDAHKMVKKMTNSLGWQEYHTPYNLILSILLEVTEILQGFQWMTQERINRRLKSIKKNEQLLFEIADICINLISLADKLKINLNDITIEKCTRILDRYRNRQGFSYGLSRNELKCPTCKKRIWSDWYYCTFCGALLWNRIEINKK